VNNNEGYTLWDIYPHADFITYPSYCEGFGNAFLEGVYFKKAMLINRYATFIRDIEPHGFDLIVMDRFLTKKTVQNVREILESTDRREKMVNLNYEIASRHYSYSVLCKRLNSIMTNYFGESDRQQYNEAPRQQRVVYLNRDPFPISYDNFCDQGRLAHAKV
jgi:glycosyltransferase involved in cell wall biosynthesis